LVELGASAEKEHASDWPSLICGAGFLEVVLVGPVGFDDLVEVRVSRLSEHDLRTWSTAYALGRLTEPDKVEVAKAWRAVRKWARDYDDIDVSIM
jgi:hypothetical protein